MSASKSTKVDRVCEVCGKSFSVFPSYVKNGRARTCSKKCNGILRCTLISVPCSHCGATVTRRKAEIQSHKRNFCSRKCRAIANILPLSERLKLHTGPQQPSGCIHWTGKTKKGYGMIECLGKKVLLAHRVAFEVANGSFDRSLCVLHKCDNPTCINPEHLFLGTQQDNVDDMISKGRKNSARGSKHGKAKLTEHDVCVLRTGYERGDISVPDFAAKHGLLEDSVLDIIRRKTWRHI